MDFAEKGARPVYVVGHKNPDTDSISSAIAYAYLKNTTGTGIVYSCQGRSDQSGNAVCVKCISCRSAHLSG